MFKIGDFSKLTNLTVRALHHYEELEILLPEKIDSFSNYRYYSASQLQTVNQIKMLQQMGLSLKVIKEVLKNNDMKLLEHHYTLREAEIKDELEQLKKKQNILKLCKEKMKAGNHLEKYNVELKEMPKRRVMSIRKTISAAEEEQMVWSALHAEFIKQQVKMANPPFGITLFHDEEYQETNIDIEVQSSIVGEYQDTDEVRFYETDEFTMASVTFSGSYDQMPEISEALASWIEANEYIICGQMINISHVSPAQNLNPENWITESGFVVCKP